MQGADGEKERAGPVLRVAALAVAVLALAAIIGPRVAASGGGSSGEPPTDASLPGGAVLATTTLPAAATWAPATPPTPDRAAMAPTSTISAEAGYADEMAADSGAVRLVLAGPHAEREGPERTGFSAGETIWWHLRVTNSGGEYLWGVFVYLELYGAVSCSERQLDVGESADCWAPTTAVPGENQAEAMVTAWTETRMVTGRASYRVDAASG